MIIYALIIFSLVMLISMTLLNWLLPDKAQRRLRELAEQGEQKSDWIKTIVDMAGPLAKLSIPEGKWEESPSRLRFINAGIRSPNAPVIFYAAKTVLPIFFAIAAYAGMRL